MFFLKFSLDDKDAREFASKILADTTFNLTPDGYTCGDGYWRGFFYSPQSPSLSVLDAGLFRSTHRVRVDVYELTLSSILRQEIEDRSRIETFMFEKLLWQPSSCVLEFIEDMRIRLFCDGISTGELIKSSTREGEYTSRFGSTGALRLLGDSSEMTDI